MVIFIVFILLGYIKIDSWIRANEAEGWLEHPHLSQHCTMWQLLYLVTWTITAVFDSMCCLLTCIVCSSKWCGAWEEYNCCEHCAKATIHQATTLLATSKYVIFPGHNHLLTTSTDDPSPHWCSGDNQSVGSSVLVVSRWLWPGNRTFLEVASMVVTCYIVAVLRSGKGTVHWIDSDDNKLMNADWFSA